MGEKFSFVFFLAFLRITRCIFMKLFKVIVCLMCFYSSTVFAQGEMPDKWLGKMKKQGYKVLLNEKYDVDSKWIAVLSKLSESGDTDIILKQWENEVLGDDDKWKAAAENHILTDAIEDSVINEVKIIPIGIESYAVLMNESGSGEDKYSIATLLMPVAQEDTPKTIFSLETSHVSNTPRYEFNADFELLDGQSIEYKDIFVTKRGKDMVDSKVVATNYQQVWTFNNGVYEKVSETPLPPAKTGKKSAQSFAN